MAISLDYTVDDASVSALGLQPHLDRGTEQEGSPLGSSPAPASAPLSRVPARGGRGGRRGLWQPSPALGAS